MDRIRIFESWGLTKGRFWKVFVTLALAVIPTLILETIITVVYLRLSASGPLSGPPMQIINNLQPDVSFCWLRGLFRPASVRLSAAGCGPHR